METQGPIQIGVQVLVDFASGALLPIMCVAFIFAMGLRTLIYFTLKREFWFAREFDKRVQNFLTQDDQKGNLSFYLICKQLLERTFYELFEVRSILKRRKADFIMTLSDRFFMITQGVAWTVKDVLKQIRHLEKGQKKTSEPKLLQISKHSFQNNPCFSKVLGLIPSHGLNDLLNVLPGVLIVCGIFGTFLGIMKALPSLATMDLNNVEGTKLVMNQFLLKVSFSMSTSIVGILLSVALNLLNTVLSPERLFVSTVDKFENSLRLLWDLSDNNHVPKGIKPFDENQDAIEALAEQSIEREVASQTLLRKMSWKNDRRRYSSDNIN